MLDYFKVEHPEIVTSFAVRIKDVMEKYRLLMLLQAWKIFWHGATLMT